MGGFTVLVFIIFYIRAFSILCSITDRQLHKHISLILFIYVKHPVQVPMYYVKSNEF